MRDAELMGILVLMVWIVFVGGAIFLGVKAYQKHGEEYRRKHPHTVNVVGHFIEGYGLVGMIIAAILTSLILK